MRIEFTMGNVAKWLKESTDWLIDNQQGCCTLKLDDHLAICVGWSAGYGDEERDELSAAIHPRGDEADGCDRLRAGDRL